MSPILPIAIVGAAIGAIALATRKGGPRPHPEDVQPILMQGAAGARQYTLRKAGPGFSWRVTGDVDRSGSDTISGVAVATMFESVFNGNNADSVTGHLAAGSNDEGMAGSFSVVQEAATKWGWIVSKPAPDQAAALGSGDSTNRGSATIAALTVLAEYTDWLVGLPTLQGDAPGPGDQPPGPNDGEGPVVGISENGITITDTAVVAYNLPQWLDYAAPIVAQRIQAGDDETEIHNSLGMHGGPNPDARKFTGRTMAQVHATIKMYLNQWATQKFLELDNIQRTIAAAAIGANISTHGKKGRVKGRPVVVRQAGLKHEWLVWEAGNRRGDQYAIYQGEAPRLPKAWQVAVSAASEATQPGQGPPSQYGVDVNIADCVGQTKVTSFSRNLPSSTFLDPWEKEIKIWTPFSAECTRYTLRLGICLVPSGGGSFGGLDYYLDGVGVGGVPTKGDADEITFGIDRHPAYNDAMDWDRFNAPIAWKRQYEIVASYVDGDLSLESVKRIEDAAADPCPDTNSRWPGRGDDHYVVRTWKKIAGQAPTLHNSNWQGQPAFELVAAGKNLNVNLSYKGLPWFKTYAGEPTVVKVQGADPAHKNSYTVAFKISATGDQ